MRTFNFWDVFAPVADTALRQQRPTGLHMLHHIDLREIFECTHLKFTVSGRSKQANIYTHVHNEVMLVWGSLRLTPIIITIVPSYTGKKALVCCRWYCYSCYTLVTIQMAVILSGKTWYYGDTYILSHQINV